MQTPRRVLDLLGGSFLGGSFLGSSAVIFIGFGAASVLGFAFLVTAARLLGPSEFGTVAYALAVAELAAVLVTTSPLGLSSFMSRYREEPATAQRYYSGWLAVVGVVLVLSLVATAAVGPAVGITGWLLVGVLCNLLGVTALETYREVARGLDRYVLVTVFYVTANLLQLIGIIVAAALGFRSAPLFVIIYGLSSVVTLLAITLVSPLRASFSLRSIQRHQTWEVLKIVQPVLLQSVFYTVWFRSDLVVVEHLQSPLATGQYGAAKTLTNALMLAPTAISFVFLPRVPRVPLQRLSGTVRRVLALMALATVPPVLLLVFAAGPIVYVLFGGNYGAAAAPLAILAVGVGMFCFCTVFTDVWLGLRRPLVDTVSTGIGMVCTLVTLPLLIGHFGLVGAAVAFSAGAAVRLVSVVAYTAPALRRIASRAGATARGLGVGQAAVVVTESPAGDAAYLRFNRELVRLLHERALVGQLGLGRVTAASRFGRLIQSVRRIHQLTQDVDEVDGHQSRVLLYVPRSSSSLPGLLRSRMLKLVAPWLTVIVVAFRPPELDGLEARLARLLWPDHLWVHTASECARLRRLGAPATSTWEGMELPFSPQPGRDERPDPLEPPRSA